MARGQDGQGRPTGAPPSEMFGQAVDIGGKARDSGDWEVVQPTYVNDIAPSVESDGTLTLRMRYIGGDGESEAVAVTMPTGLFAELIFLAPQLVEGAAIRAAAQGAKLAKVAHASGSEEDAIIKILRDAGTLPAEASVTDLGGRRG